MRNKIQLGILIALLQFAAFMPAKAEAAEFDTTFSYDRATLAYWQARYQKSMPKMLDTLRNIGLTTRGERDLVANIELVQPLSAAELPPNLRNSMVEPFVFFALPDQRTIYMSVTSTLFVQDLSKVYAWLYYSNCSFEPLADYLAMLKYHQPGDFPGGRYPTPLEVFDIPSGTFDDDDNDTPVEAMALSLFNEARAFIIAHELGHIRYQHGSSATSLLQAQEEESQADAYALNVLATTQSVPMGAYLLFFAWTNYLHNRWDFDSAQAWQDYLAHATHPWTPKRMQALARGLKQSAGLFPAAESGIVASLADMAEELAIRTMDPDIQKSIRLVGEGTTLAGLKTLCSETITHSPPVQPFDGAFTGEFTHFTAEGVESFPVTTELRRSGDNVAGTFDFGLGVGRITGLVKKNTLYFSWRWSSAHGLGMFDMGQDGSAFSGVWGYRDSSSNGGTWTGRAPQP